MGAEFDDPLVALVHAAAFASFKHRKQRRKDVEATPYINHPLALAEVLAREGGVRDPVVLVAAILHDTIEDTETSREEIVEQFGEEVADIVVEVTDDKSLPKAERKRRQVEHAPQLSSRARLVKLADKICNLRDMTAAPPADWALARRQDYFDWAKAVVDGMRGEHGALEGLFDAAYVRRP